MWRGFEICLDVGFFGQYFQIQTFKVKKWKMQIYMFLA